MSSFGIFVTSWLPYLPSNKAIQLSSVSRFSLGESSERVEHAIDFGVIEAADDQLSTRANERGDRGGARRQHSAGEVREHEVGGLWRIVAEIQHLKRDRVGQRVQARAGFSGIDRVLIDVDADDAARAHQRRGHRQHARARSEIQHRRIATSISDSSRRHMRVVA